MQLNGQPHEVVGVLPQGFTFLQNDLDVFLPAAFQPQAKSDNARHNNNWQMVGRLKDGATLDQVRQQVAALNARNDERFPQFRQILKDARFQTISVMLQDDVVRDVKTSLYLLWGGVSFVLLIGVANIANLIIVRSSGRRRELATRHAIGGDLGRLARQLVTETTVLSIAGGAFGVLIGWWILRSMATLNLTMLPRGYEIGLDWIAVAYIVSITLAVGVCLGLAPALRLRTMNLNLELRQESRGGTSSRRANLIRRGLAVVQVAIALALLVGAGLLFASFRAVLRLDLGFDPENVMTAAVSLPASQFPNPAALITFEQRALAAIRALPDVEAAGTTSAVPFSGAINNNVILAEGYEMKPGESLLAPSSVNVNPGYFEALHVQLVRGRFIDARDTQNAPATVMIDDRLARKFWPDQDPVGRRLYFPSDPSDITKITEKTTFLTIVGVIREIRMIDPRPDVTPVGTVYFPWEQQAGRGPTLVVKTRRDAPALTQQHPARDRHDQSAGARVSRAHDAGVDRSAAHRPPAADVRRAGVWRRRAVARGHRDVRRARLQRQRAPARAGRAHGARRLVRQRVRPRAPRRRSRDRRRAGARTDRVLLGRSRGAEPARGRRAVEPDRVPVRRGAPVGRGIDRVSHSRLAREPDQSGGRARAVDRIAADASLSIAFAGYTARPELPSAAALLLFRSARGPHRARLSGRSSPNHLLPGPSGSPRSSWQRRPRTGRSDSQRPRRLRRKRDDRVRGRKAHRR